MTTTQELHIRQHGEQLLAIFPQATERDPVKLCKKLRKIEVCAHTEAEQWCNGEIDELVWNILCGGNLRRIHNILQSWDVPIFINGDPRGYALKIDDEYMRAHKIELHKDWGGYGIIAPEIND